MDTVNGRMVVCRSSKKKNQAATIYSHDVVSSSNVTINWARKNSTSLGRTSMPSQSAPTKMMSQGGTTNTGGGGGTFRFSAKNYKNLDPIKRHESCCQRNNTSTNASSHITLNGHELRSTSSSKMKAAIKKSLLPSAVGNLFRANNLLNNEPIANTRGDTHTTTPVNYHDYSPSSSKFLSSVKDLRKSFKSLLNETATTALSSTADDSTSTAMNGEKSREEKKCNSADHQAAQIENRLLALNLAQHSTLQLTSNVYYYYYYYC
jgi:hypothetical protein